MRKTYLSETALGLIAAVIFGSVAFAGPFGLPDHQPDGYRDTGCDPAQQVAVEGTNYFNNPSCPSIGGAGAELGAYLASLAEDDGEEEPGEEEPGEEEPGECKGDCEIVSK